MYWTAHKANGSKQWSWRRKFWRVQVGITVYRHVYAVSSDRWVVHPSFVYDCKRK